MKHAVLKVTAAVLLAMTPCWGCGSLQVVQPTPSADEAAAGARKLTLDYLKGRFGAPSGHSAFNELRYQLARAGATAEVLGGLAANTPDNIHAWADLARDASATADEISQALALADRLATHRAGWRLYDDTGENDKVQLITIGIVVIVAAIILDTMGGGNLMKSLTKSSSSSRSSDRSGSDSRRSSRTMPSPSAQRATGDQVLNLMGARGAGKAGVAPSSGPVPSGARPQPPGVVAPSSTPAASPAQAAKAAAQPGRPAAQSGNVQAAGVPSNKGQARPAAAPGAGQVQKQQPAGQPPSPAGNGAGASAASASSGSKSSPGKGQMVVGCTEGPGCTGKARTAPPKANAAKASKSPAQGGAEAPALATDYPWKRWKPVASPGCAGGGGPPQCAALSSSFCAASQQMQACWAAHPATAGNYCAGANQSVNQLSQQLSACRQSAGATAGGQAPGSRNQANPVDPVMKELLKQLNANRADRSGPADGAGPQVKASGEKPAGTREDESGNPPAEPGQQQSKGPSDGDRHGGGGVSAPAPLASPDNQGPESSSGPVASLDRPLLDAGLAPLATSRPKVDDEWPQTDGDNLNEQTQDALADADDAALAAREGVPSQADLPAILASNLALAAKREQVAQDGMALTGATLPDALDFSPGAPPPLCGGQPCPTRPTLNYGKEPAPSATGVTAPPRAEAPGGAPSPPKSAQEASPRAPEGSDHAPKEPDPAVVPRNSGGAGSGGATPEPTPPAETQKTFAASVRTRLHAVADRLGDAAQRAEAVVGRVRRVGGLLWDGLTCPGCIVVRRAGQFVDDTLDGR